jgi:hypothetical protein
MAIVIAFEVRRVTERALEHGAMLVRERKGRKPFIELGLFFFGELPGRKRSRLIGSWYKFGVQESTSLVFSFSLLVSEFFLFAI